MLIFDEDRASDSPYVERVWRSHSEGAGSFVSVAESRAEIVVAKCQGRVSVWVRGPETRATHGPYLADGEWLGIRFKPGAYVLPQPARKLVDRKVSLPEAMRGSFWLNGSRWQVPRFDNADTFVEWLVREDLLVADPAVAAALLGEAAGSSLRTLQRHFLQATGITHGLVRQIERARNAALLLRGGVAIADAVREAGYFDQPHLTRSMRRFIGQTPAELLDAYRSDQLSFLYKTQPFAMP
jgi:AraC-like DNA-binding protein